MKLSVKLRIATSEEKNRLPRKARPSARRSSPIPSKGRRSSLRPKREHNAVATRESSIAVTIGRNLGIAPEPIVDALRIDKKGEKLEERGGKGARRGPSHLKRKR